jgi:inosose dehydratase
MATRRKFIQTTATGMAASVILPGISGGTAFAPFSKGDKKEPLQLGIAGYTFVKYSIEQSIAMMRRVGIGALSIKDFHLPYDCTKEKAEEVKATFAAGGISIYAAGVIYMKTNEEVDRAFDYVQRAGINLIIGSPTIDMLPYVEKKIKSTGIRVAIHNHGPEDKLYAGPKEIFDQIKSLDSRMGICLDIGHCTRALQDPVKAVLQYGPRIFDLHIKDLLKAIPEETPTELGRGIIDIPGLLQALYKISFTGRCSIEFERDMTDSLPGIAESAGYFRGVNKVIVMK